MGRIPFLTKTERSELAFDKQSANRARILQILEKIQGRRPGLSQVITELKASKYFSAKCRRHHHYAGGLAEYSLGVYEVAMRHCGRCDSDSLAICALFHDLGVLENHHGHTSIKILRQWGFTLKNNEIRAIKFFMMIRNPGEEDEFEKTRHDPLWQVLHFASFICLGGYKRFTEPWIMKLMPWLDNRELRRRQR